MKAFDISGPALEAKLQAAQGTKEAQGARSAGAAASDGAAGAAAQGAAGTLPQSSAGGAAQSAADVSAEAQTAAGAGTGIAILDNAQVPRTVAEVRNLISMREELSDQLVNASARSNTLASELQFAPDAAKAGITERLHLLQDRIISMETQLATTGMQLAQTPAILLSQASRTTSSTQSSGLGDDEIGDLALAFILFVLAPIAIAFALRIFKRGRRQPESPRDVENAQRLKRMEHAVDATAIEVERISEGQRFLTNIFAREHSQRHTAVASGTPAPESAHLNTPPHS